MDLSKRPSCRDCTYHYGMGPNLSAQCGHPGAAGNADQGNQRASGRVMAFIRGTCGREGRRFVPHASKG